MTTSSYKYQFYGKKEIFLIYTPYHKKINGYQDIVFFEISYVTVERLQARSSSLHVVRKNQ